MRSTGRKARRIVPLLLGVAVTLGVGASSASAAVKVTWMSGYPSPGTPSSLNRVGVIKIGASSAKNVLVLEPGTSAGGGYFVPFAEWLVKHTRDWQVWSVERRENLLEDQSLLNRAKDGKATAKQMFDYYLGFLADSTITHHIKLIPDSSVGFARQWGLRVVVEDLHRVIAAAKRLGGRVVLGGHSLGGSVVTAYATWDFHGKPGADDLAGLVYDDGGSLGTPVTAAAATAELQKLAGGTPWLAFSTIPAPYLGLFSATGSLSALIAPNASALGYTFPLLPANLKPPVPVTNQALFGYDVDTKTSKLSFAAQAHVGQLDTSVSPARWSRAGAITPIERWASMLAGAGIQNVDGTEWYFPQRLTYDTGAVAEGNPNPAQSVLDVKAIHGHELPTRLRIYAFGAFGGTAITLAATTLANQSHIPTRNLTLISRQGTYAHNDPAAAYPNNAFFNNLVPFLEKLSPHHSPAKKHAHRR